MVISRIKLIFLSLLKIFSGVMALLVIVVAFFFFCGRNPVADTYGKVLYVT